MDLSSKIGECFVLAGNGASYAGRLQSFDPEARLAVFDNWTAEATFRVDEGWTRFTHADGTCLELRAVSLVIPAGSGAYKREGN